MLLHSSSFGTTGDLLVHLTASHLYMPLPRSHCVYTTVSVQK